VRKKSDDFDEEEGEKLDEGAQLASEIIENIADCVGKLARLHKEAFLPPFQEFLLPVVLAMLAPTQCEDER
jgi:hypothetical protein